MKEKALHKFKEKMEETYEQLFRIRYGDVVQLAREFERVLGREKTFEIIGTMFERKGFSTAKRMTEEYPIVTFQDFVTFYKRALKDPLFAHAVTAQTKDETPTTFALEITECLWAQTFREMDAADLGYIIMCQPDFSMAKAYHPNIKLKRTKTLMEGHDSCNHTYYWEG